MTRKPVTSLHKFLCNSSGTLPHWRTTWTASADSAIFRICSYIYSTQTLSTLWLNVNTGNAPQHGWWDSIGRRSSSFAHHYYLPALGHSPPFFCFPLISSLFVTNASSSRNRDHQTRCACVPDTQNSGVFKIGLTSIAQMSRASSFSDLWTSIRMLIICSDQWPALSAPSAYRRLRIHFWVPAIWRICIFKASPQRIEPALEQRQLENGDTRSDGGALWWTFVFLI
jgi:hypothetical protein